MNEEQDCDVVDKCMEIASKVASGEWSEFKGAHEILELVHKRETQAINQFHARILKEN